MNDKRSDADVQTLTAIRGRLERSLKREESESEMRRARKEDVAFLLRLLAQLQGALTEAETALMFHQDTGRLHKARAESAERERDEARQMLTQANAVINEATARLAAAESRLLASTGSQDGQRIAADVEAARYIRDLAGRLMDYPTENWKEAYEALVGYADELVPAPRHEETSRTKDDHAR